MDVTALVVDKVVSGTGRVLMTSKNNKITNIAPPAITYPITGGVDFAGDIVSSVYATPANFEGIHIATDWEVASDSNFANILVSSYDDMANLVSYAPNLNIPNSIIYIRNRYKTTTHMTDWSTVASVTTAAISISPPTITVAGGPTSILEAPILTSSAFTVIGGADTHVSTDWTITDMSGVLVWQSLADTVNLTTITVPTGNLLVSTDYIFSVRYNSATRSSGHSVVKGTTRYTFNYIYVDMWDSNAALLPSIRYSHGQSTLQDGKVLVTGGYNGTTTLSTSYVYDPALDTWTTVAPLPSIRHAHNQSTLQDGKVLVTGGYNGTTYLSSCYVYDPVLNTWSTVTPLPNIQYAHGQSTLQDGKVLVTGGGVGITVLSTCYVYDPALDTWSTVAPLPNIRRAHGQSTLHDGKVLVTGGGDGTTSLSTSYVYDPALDTWTTVAPLPNIRHAHNQSTLQDGKVLVTGGYNGTATLSTCYVYDPTLNTWSTVAPLPNIRQAHNQSTLHDGKVLVTGGWDGITYLSTCYVYY